MMPEFTICAKSEVKKTVKRFEATHLCTMLDVGDHVFRPPRILPQNHLKLNFEDEEDPTKWAAPTLAHAETILAWGKTLPSDARVAVHCFAGMCRSTAAGIALWLQANGTDQLAEAGVWLQSVRPQACPNLLMAAHFDQILNLQGELVKLCDHIGAESVNRWWKLNHPD
jgi:predicted protein tyrosine phosphatase